MNPGNKSLVEEIKLNTTLFQIKSLKQISE